MMAVMAFDADRRGRLISQSELADYTCWLAKAVTDALFYFIDGGRATPNHPARYLAASGAHVAHMLRDALDDAGAGYYNIPREVLAAEKISPLDICSEAYRTWVAARVRLAREYFAAGKDNIMYSSLIGYTCIMGITGKIAKRAELPRQIIQPGS